MSSRYHHGQLLKVGVIQSNYLPWRGYFDLVDDVDLFVFYDDVQFTKNDWRNRNRIKTAVGIQWLTVPVRHLTSGQLILETSVDDTQPWRKKHLKSLAQWYGQTPFFTCYYAVLAELLGCSYPSLAALNHALCRWLMTELGITTTIRHSGDFHLTGTRGERLLDLLGQLGATHYISGPSARDYLDIGQFARHGIRVDFKTYDYMPYSQPWGPFVGDVTVLDLLFNVGPESRSFLKSRTPAESAVAPASPP